MNLEGYNMKICSKCQSNKEFCEFNKKSDSKDGHHPYCKECRKNEFKLYYEEKKTELLKYQKEYYLNNSEKVKNREKDKRKNNPEISKKYELKRKLKRKEYLSKYFIKGTFIINRPLNYLNKYSPDQMMVVFLFRRKK